MKKPLLLLVLGWVPNHAFAQTTAELYRITGGSSRTTMNFPQISIPRGG